MAKLKTFKANDTFVEFIKGLGFQYRHVDSEKQYYVNQRGNQIKIDRDTGIITLLNSRGYVVDYSNVYTSKQISEFAEKDN